MGKIGEENGGSDRATETKLKSCIKKTKQAETKSIETIKAFRLALHRGAQHTKKWGVFQGKEQPHFHSCCFAQSLASPDLNNETVWISLRPAADLHNRTKKSWVFLPFSEKI